MIQVLFIIFINIVEVFLINIKDQVFFSFTKREFFILIPIFIAAVADIAIFHACLSSSLKRKVIVIIWRMTLHNILHDITYKLNLQNLIFITQVFQPISAILLAELRLSKTKVLRISYK